MHGVPLGKCLQPTGQDMYFQPGSTQRGKNDHECILKVVIGAIIKGNQLKEICLSLLPSCTLASV